MTHTTDPSQPEEVEFFEDDLCTFQLSGAIFSVGSDKTSGVPRRDVRLKTRRFEGTFGRGWKIGVLFISECKWNMLRFRQCARSGDVLSVLTDHFTSTLSFCGIPAIPFGTF